MAVEAVDEDAAGRRARLAMDEVVHRDDVDPGTVVVRRRQCVRSDADDDVVDDLARVEREPTLLRLRRHRGELGTIGRIQASMVLLASDTSVNMTPKPFTTARWVVPGWKNCTSITCAPRGVKRR